MTMLAVGDGRVRMGRAATDVARMLTLIPWLLERPGVSVDETAATFGVAAATIRRDLHHLDFCGLPGLGGGDLFQVDLVADRVVVSMADELKRPLRPTATEALRLVLTVDGVAEVLGEEVPALRSAVAKVRVALGIPGRVADVLPGEPLAVLGQLRDAVRDARQVAFQYRGRADDEPRARHVEPWQLHVVDGTWYLQGLDVPTQSPRVFRIDRMFGVEGLPSPRQHPVPATLPEPRYEPSAHAVRIELEIAAAGRWVLGAVDAELMRQDGNGTMRVMVLTDAPSWIVDLVMSAAGSVVIADPPWLREQAHRRALKARTAINKAAGAA